MNKKIMSGAAALVLAGAISPTAFAAENVGTTTNMPSGEEVVNYWKNYQSRSEDKMDYKGVQLTSTGRQIDDANTYEEAPKEDGSYEGKLKDEVKEDALHVINSYRYMSGLDEVVENKGLSDLAQSGAYIGYLNNGISHYPETPEKLTDERIINDGKLATSESNIAIGYGTIYDSMQAYMDDEDPSNYNTVGHRRWFLNAHAKEVGIGQVGSANATYVASDDNITFYSTAVVPYPANNMISDMIHPDAPFSIQFGNNFELESTDGVTVTVENKSTGEVKTYTGENGLVLDSQSMGNGASLIFGAELSKEVGSQYRVSISGITLDGKDYPVAYDVNFISQDVQPKPEEEVTPDTTPEETPDEETSDENNEEGNKYSVTQDFEDAHDGKIKITSSNAEVGEPDENGHREFKIDKKVVNENGEEIIASRVMYFIKEVGDIDENGERDVLLEVVYGEEYVGDITLKAKAIGFEKPEDNEKPSDDNEEPSDGKDEGDKPSDDKEEENQKPESLTDKPFDTREEAEEAAKEALKTDPINKSFKVSQGKDGKFYVQLSPVEEEKPVDKPENEEKPSDNKKGEINNTVTVKPKKTETKKEEEKKEDKNETSDEKVKTGITGAGIVGGALAAALVGYKATKKRD